KPGGLDPVPPDPFKDFRQRPPFGILCTPPTDFPQPVGTQRGGKGRRGDGVRSRAPTAGPERRINRLAVSENDQTANDILQFANISRPSLLKQERDRLGGEHLVPLILLVEPSQEERGEEGDFLPALSERGDFDLDDIETRVEVVPELAIAQG